MQGEQKYSGLKYCWYEVVGTSGTIYLGGGEVNTKIDSGIDRTVTTETQIEG